MQEQTESVQSNSKAFGEIELGEVIKSIFAGRKIIYKTVALFLVFGIVFVLGSPKEYRSDVILLEEFTSKTGGMSGILSQFGGLLGLSESGGSGGSSLTPQLYPTIIKSTPFLLEVSKQKVIESKFDSLLTVADFFDRYSKPSFFEKLRKYTIGLPGTIFGLFKGESKGVTKYKSSNIFTLSPLESKSCVELSQRIEIKEGQVQNDNTLRISVEMQDPFVASQLTDSVVKCLTKYVIDYRTQKAQRDLNFIQNLYDDAKLRFLKAQQALANYRDQNKNVVLASSKVEEERLQMEFSLTSTLYNNLTQQLEQAKIRVQESTPVFKIIEPSKLGGQSKPSTIFILIIMLFLGGFAGIGLVLLMFLKSKYNAQF